MNARAGVAAAPIGLEHSAEGRAAWAPYRAESRSPTASSASAGFM
jgi:hypothetical protein